MNEDDKVTIHTPHGKFWIHKRVLKKAIKAVTTMYTRWDEFSTTIVIGGITGARPYGTTSYYSYSVKVGVYADTGNIFTKVKVIKRQKAVNLVTRAVSWSSEVVYTDMRRTHTLGREVI